MRRPIHQASEWVAPRIEWPAFFSQARPRAVTLFPPPKRVPCVDGSYAHRRAISYDGPQEMGTCRLCGDVKRYSGKRPTYFDKLSPEESEIWSR